MNLSALCIYAGPLARRHIASHGLQAADVACIPAAAGGPKGLILGRLDQFLFGEWLPKSQQPIDLLGASIGAWRMATACLNDAPAAFARLEHDYIAQHYALKPGQKRPPASEVSAQFRQNLNAFYGGRLQEVLQHPRFRLHLIAARGRHIMRKRGGLRAAVGYAGAYVSNAVARPALGAWLQRVVFSTANAQALPFDTRDISTRRVTLTERNFMDALQASCSIPFVLDPVTHITDAPSGCYWDGGITDYHLHMHYHPQPDQGAGLVLYPHFQQAVVPGWLDKALKWRHTSTRALDRMVVLAPHPQWVATLPNGKLPDRTDFTRFAHDFETRRRIWSVAVDASQQLVDELAAWLEKPDVTAIRPL